MPLTLDVFDGEGFRPITLTGWVNENVPFQPTFLSSLGLFTSTGVYTTDVAFDESSGALSLIQSSPRGSAPAQSQGAKGKGRKVETVRLAKEAVITADEIANIRALGTTDLRTAERVLFSRIEGPIGLKAQLSYTMEHMRLGAIDGIVYDADGTTALWNFFTIYGVSRPAAVELVIVPTSATGPTPLLGGLTKLKRSMLGALNGLPTGGAQIIILCGDNFFDDVNGCAEVVEARKVQATGNSNAPKIIAENKAYSSFVYGDCIFVNYRGSDDSKVKIDTDSARATFMGVPGLYQEFYAPADTFDFVNTEGLPSYIIQRRERQGESFRTFEVQSNPLLMNMRPLHTRELTIAE